MTASGAVALQQQLLLGVDEDEAVEQAQEMEMEMEMEEEGCKTSRVEPSSTAESAMEGATAAPKFRRTGT